jgi:surface antigen
LRWFAVALGGWGLAMMLCFPVLARTTHEGHGGNCVAYAREVTGIRLDGNAAAWWQQAEGRYERGSRPSPGAVLVFKPYAGMHVGHVAVVSRVVSSRAVLVDQANWVRGQVTTAMSVVDASPLNDWTSVKVQFGGTHGRANPTFGFIYPRAEPTDFAQSIAQENHEHRRATAVAARDKHQKRRHELAAAAGAGKAPRRLADSAPTGHRHKPPDARLAFVY